MSVHTEDALTALRTEADELQDERRQLSLDLGTVQGTVELAIVRRQLREVNAKLAVLAVTIDKLVAVL